MNKQKCLHFQDKILQEAQHQRKILAALYPCVGPIILSYQPRRYLHGRPGPLCDEACKVACEIITFNLCSIRCRILAIERIVAPFHIDFRSSTLPNTPVSYKYIDYHDRHALKFSCIESVSPLPKVDLPLLLGWPFQYPRLAELLKGEKPRNRKSEVMTART